MRESTVKDRILDTASRLFYDQGYHVTGINQIIEEAEIARASFSRRWRCSGFCDKRSGNTLMATVRSRRVSHARYTSPMPPAPSGVRISNGPSLVPKGRDIGGAIIPLEQDKLVAGVIRYFSQSAFLRHQPRRTTSQQSAATGSHFWATTGREVDAETSFWYSVLA